MNIERIYGMASREGGHQYREEIRIGMHQNRNDISKGKILVYGRHTHREKIIIWRTLV